MDTLIKLTFFLKFKNMITKMIKKKKKSEVVSEVKMGKRVYPRKNRHKLESNVQPRLH
jgi:hypothetical protein